MLKRFVIALALFILAGPWPALADLTLKDGRLYYQDGQEQKSAALAEGALTKVRGADLFYMLINDPDILAAEKEVEGLFFFDKNGKMTARLEAFEGFDPEMCAAATMSPDGKILALDNGTWLVRVWAFMQYPQMIPAGGETDSPFLSYISGDFVPEPGLVWVDGDSVIVTDISEAPVSRPCPSDLCEPMDVVLHRISTRQSTALSTGDELCDSRFGSLAGRTVTINRICVKKIEDWDDLENADKLRSRTRLKVNLPAKY